MSVSSSRFLRDIDENFLQCSICIESFRTATARILPCLHSFCEVCLQKLIFDEAGCKKIKCPICKRSHELPEGLDSIPKNRFLNELSELFGQHEDAKRKWCGACKQGHSTSRCIDCKKDICDACTRVHEELGALSTHRVMLLKEYEELKMTSPAEIQPPVCCTEHPLNNVTLYCDTCDVPICFECTVLDHDAPHHKYRKIRVVESEYKEQLTKMMGKLLEKAREAKVSEQKVKRVTKSLQSRFQCEEKKLNEHIEKTIQEVVAKIRKNGKNLMSEMKEEYETRIGKLEAQKKEIQIVENDMKYVADFIEKLMEYGNAGMVMNTKKAIMLQFQELMASNTKQKPEAHGYIEFLPSNIETVDIGAVAFCKLKIVSVLDFTRVSDQLEVVLELNPRHSDKGYAHLNNVKAEITCTDDVTEDAQTAYNKDGTALISYRAKVEGRHELHVVGAKAAPITLNVIPQKGLLYKYGTSGKRDGELDVPRSVAITGHGNYVVCDRGRMHIFSPKWNHLNTVKLNDSQGNIISPCDIAISRDGSYFLTDVSNRRIAVCDENFKNIRCFGKKEIQRPNDIAISPVNGIVYVCDYEAHCTRIYKQDGEYITSFGSEGNGECQFNEPRGIEVDGKGDVIVADTKNHRIQVFTPDGLYIHSFGTLGSDPQQFTLPCGVACDKDCNIYVCDWDNHRVMKYDSRGRFLSRIDGDEDGLKYPRNICIIDDKPYPKVVVNSTTSQIIAVYAQ